MMEGRLRESSGGFGLGAGFLVSPFVEGCFDGINHAVRGGGTCGDTDGVGSLDPRRVEVACVLQPMDPGAAGSAGVHQTSGVVAVDAANDQHHIAAPSEVFSGGLTVFGGLANGVNPSYF